MNKKIITNNREPLPLLEQQINLMDIGEIDRPLYRDFFTQDAEDLARALIGKIIVRKFPEGIVKAMIVETEAYKAPQDKASHAYNNKKTERTKYVWLEGGHLYIYSIYFNSLCIDIVASQKDIPECVLVRAVEPIEGIELIRTLRKKDFKRVYDLTNGPGKVGMALGINKTYNGFDLTKGEEFYIIEGQTNLTIEVSKRVNINYAEEWKDKLWRFYVKDNKFVSKGK